MKKQFTIEPNYRKPFTGFLQFAFILALLLQVTGMAWAQIMTTGRTKTWY